MEHSKDGGDWEHLGKKARGSAPAIPAPSSQDIHSLPSIAGTDVTDMRCSDGNTARHQAKQRAA